MTRLYRILEWIMWIAYINLLWVGFTLLGLIAIGIFPATVASFAVMRMLLMKGHDEVSIFKTFVQTYKKEFLKANGIGFIMVTVGYILYLDFVFIGNMSGAPYYLLQIALYFVGFVYLITLLYIIPVYVHFKLNFVQYFRQAIIIGILSPMMTISMVLGLVLSYYLYRLIPGLFPVTVVGVTALLLMFCGLCAFRRLENKQKVMRQSKQVNS